MRLYVATILRLLTRHQQECFNTMVFRACLIIFISFILCSCDNYSVYPIDATPNLKTDTSIFGIWKCVEDTSVSNALIIQGYNDVFRDIEEQYGSVEKYSRTMTNDPFATDVMTKGRIYYVTSNFRGVLYQIFRVFASEIDREQFFNMPNAAPSDLHQYGDGYIFVKIIKRTKDSIVTTLVNDSILKHLNSAQNVRERITSNLNNLKYFTDTLHFYKISTYHSDVETALRIGREYGELKR